MTQKPEIEIGIACDGFTIILDGVHYHVDQEDDPSLELSKLFESMGYTVTVSEFY